MGHQTVLLRNSNRSHPFSIVSSEDAAFTQLFHFSNLLLISALPSIHNAWLLWIRICYSHKNMKKKQHINTKSLFNWIVQYPNEVSLIKSTRITYNLWEVSNFSNWCNMFELKYCQISAIHSFKFICCIGLCTRIEFTWDLWMKWPYL